MNHNRKKIYSGDDEYLLRESLGVVTKGRLSERNLTSFDRLTAS